MPKVAYSKEDLLALNKNCQKEPSETTEDFQKLVKNRYMNWFLTPCKGTLKVFPHNDDNGPASSAILVC